MEFTELIDLASEKLGGAVLFANDDFFAPKENLLKASAPVFIEAKYTDRENGWTVGKAGGDERRVLIGASSDSAAGDHSRRHRRHEFLSWQLSRTLFARRRRITGLPTVEVDGRIGAMGTAAAADAASPAIVKTTFPFNTTSD